MDADLGLLISALGVLVFVSGSRGVWAPHVPIYSYFPHAAEMYFLFRKS